MDWRAKLEALGVPAGAEGFIAVTCVLFGALLGHITVGRLVRRGLSRLARSTHVTWDDALIDSKVFDRLVHLVPLAIIYGSLQILHAGGLAAAIVERAIGVAIVVVVARVFDAALEAGNGLYQADPERRARPIRGYVQVLRIFLWIGAVVVGVAAAVDRSPLLFLSGIGALTAVLLLVFKDTILGLVASVQLSGDDLIRVNDWIEVPSAGVNGDVVDIALHTIKVQNFDKTVTTIPTYSLISQPFKNWRTMTEAGGRRIKRALTVEHSSIRHLTAEEITRLSSVDLLRSYMAKKEEALARDNAAVATESPSVATNLRRLTNVGTYRAYLEAYLRANPAIHETFTLMVRQLDPSPQGLPLEIYCFTKTTNWAEFEGIQADIFDHAIAVADEFALRVYQAPSSDDLRAFEALISRPSSSGSLPSRR